ncbi:hypothetical protein Y032_0090g2349 [Ancylostoma ceylanicum]|nr:hypothetical protein Y032_0090g2349 [Ancylostoma ceylanicum]
MSLMFVGVCFFLGATLISVPVYSAVLYVIATHRRLRIFRSSFYALTLSNGVFDLTSAILFVALECFPHLTFANEMFWNNRSTYLPTFSLGLTFMLLFIRIFGIASLVLERTAEAFYGESVLEQLLNRPMCCLSTIFRWMVSLVLAWPVFIQMDISYEKVDGETMTFIPDHDIQVDVLLAAIVVCSCTLVCTLSCLFLVLRLVTNAQAVTKHSQYHLTLQSLGSYVVLLAMTIHFSVIYLQNPKLDTAIRQMAAWFFFYNAFLTYIHPWILLLFNGEIRRRLTSLGSPSATSKCDQLVHITRIPISI